MRTVPAISPIKISENCRLIECFTLTPMPLKAAQTNHAAFSDVSVSSSILPVFF